MTTAATNSAIRPAWDSLMNGRFSQKIDVTRPPPFDLGLQLRPDPRIFGHPVPLPAPGRPRSAMNGGRGKVPGRATSQSRR
jgi:hypothetical protein